MTNPDILDEPEYEHPPEQDEDTRRISRFFGYALGMIALVLIRFYWVFSSHLPNRDAQVLFSTIEQSILIAVCGLWLFAGLGLTAGIRTARRHTLTRMQRVYTMLHAVLLLGSSVLLLWWVW